MIGMGLLAALLSGCPANASLPAKNSSPFPVDHGLSVRVAVTRDFGKVVLVEKTLEIGQNTTALDALGQVAEVKTKHGGGFVSAINGIGSEYEAADRTKKDWLFYVNGMSSNVGTSAYILRDGDIQHWDFHDWSFRMFIPAIIGDLPEPFRHGYQGQVRPTVIVYEDGWEKDAKTLAAMMNGLGVQSVAAQNASQLTADDKQHSNLVLLGTKDSRLVSELNQTWEKLGFFVHFEGSKMVVHDATGKVAAQYGAGSGVIQATQSPWNPKGTGVGENVVWMVSGTDENGLKDAVSALLNRHKEFQYAYAVVAAGGEIIRVPR